MFRRRVHALGAVLSITVLAACGSTGGGGSSATGGGGEQPSIVVATGVDTAYGVLLAAVEQGFFKKNGVNASLKIFQNGIDAVQGVATGQADLGGGGAATVINPAAKGAHVKLIGAYSESDKQTGIVAIAAVTKPQDLVGRNVCTQANGDGEYYYHQYTAHFHLNEKAIHFKDVSLELLPEALAKGECDVIVSQEPAITRALQVAKGSHVLTRGGDDNIHPLLVQAAVSQKVYSNEKLAEAVVKSLVQTGNWANAHHSQMAALLTSHFRIPADQATTFVGYFNFSFRFDNQTLKNLQNTATYNKQKGNIPSSFDLNKYLFPEPARAVVPNLTYSG